MATGNICKLLLIFACFVTCLGASSNLGVCFGVTPCYCKYDNGQYLQLNDLGHKDGTPRLVNNEIFVHKSIICWKLKYLY